MAKAFGGTQALKGVSFEVARGEIVALLGENGAGKSTLIKVLGGVHAADSGAITLGAVPYHHAARQAVSFIHQDLGLIEWMTVAENVGLARGFARSAWLGALGVIDWAASAKFAREALQLVGCDLDPETRVQTLSRTEKSLVAIARALVANCDFLVLDEPTASLPADEVERLFAAMRTLKARNVGMIYVSHRLDEIFRIADRVVVLRDGRVVGVEAVAETTPDQLVKLIVGRSTFDAFEKKGRPLGERRVTVSDLATEHAGPVDFELRQGELLGLVGLRGAGQEEIGRALFGAIAHRGEIVLDGERYDLTTPHAAVRLGVGMMARDRAEESVAGSLSVRENAFLNPGASGRGLLSPLSPRAEASQAEAVGRSVNLQPNAPDLPIEKSFGRQSAKGRRRTVARDGASPVGGGRSDCGRRRRRQGRDLPADRARAR